MLDAWQVHSCAIIPSLSEFAVDLKTAQEAQAISTSVRQ